MRSELKRQIREAKHRLAPLTRTPTLLALGYVGLALTLTIVLRQRTRVEPLRDVWGVMPAVATDSGTPAPRLTFVFNARDCPDSRQSIAHWNELHETGRLIVRGVMLDGPKDRERLARLMSLFEIRFPVTTRPEDVTHGVREMLTLGYRQTPVAILTDPRGRPRLVLPPSQDGTVQQMRTGLLETTLRALEQEAQHERSEDRAPA